MTEIKPTLFSDMVKTKGKTYFLDVKEAKNNSKYLIITEAGTKDGQKFRKSITVFADAAEELNKKVTSLVEKMK